MAMPLFHKIHSQSAQKLNTALLAGFLQHENDENIRKTHLFEGRYENIYLNHQHIPQLNLLMTEAVILAEEITATPGLRAGYWFNYMPPGSITLPHTHDDNDELLSAAYYIYVPENSGDLILHSGTDKLQLQPQEGDFILFKPDVSHEVSKNNSAYYRLSIGINFGLKTNPEQR